LEELDSVPIMLLSVTITDPEFEIVRLLDDPLSPTVRVLALVQSDPGPFTSTELLEELACPPIKLLLTDTMPDPEMDKLLNEPSLPIRRSLAMVQRELLVTATELLEEADRSPIKPTPAIVTVLDPDMVRLLEEPRSPT
jgi:hypothetical protein